MRATINRLKLTQELELNGSGLFDDLNIEEEEDDEEENDVENEEDECADRKMQLIEPILEGVRCAEHTLQLAVSDTLKETNMKEQLLEIRKIVKTLRKLPYKKLFAVSKRSKPKLDCPTRWNSTYGMDINIMNELNDRSRMPRLKLPRAGNKEVSIVDWWYGFRSSKPELYNLVAAFLAIPCTQVSVERSFSVLALILTKHRTLLSEENLRNILFIRLNQELLRKVNLNKT